MNVILSAFLTLIMAICVVFSCNGPNVEAQKEREGTFSAKVIIPAGDIYPRFNNLDIPTFFNVAKISSNSGVEINSIIFGEKKSKGVKLSVYPVALLNFTLDTMKYKFVISVDANNTKIKTDYNSFLINNYNLQSSLENWFKSQCAPKDCNNFIWDNAYKALLEVN